MKTWKELKPEVHEKPFLLDSECEEWIRAIQRDSLLEAAEIVNTLSRGTKSEDRAIAIDEARDAILEKVRETES